MVCGAAIGYGEHLQNLCGELPGGGPPELDSERGSGDRGSRAGDRGMSVFPPEYRGSGLLLHVTSLPSAYGIGDVGPCALAWIDRLQEAGQGWWQALPLGPTGYGNS